MNILITGAAGAVGRIAVQIAKDIVGKSGEVIAVAGRGNAEALKEELGEDIQVVGGQNWADEVSSAIDVVFDMIGGEFLEKCIDLVVRPLYCSVHLQSLKC
jgi:NADPH:quinone reductase-like Zn-dependent oxidoreductase